MRRHKSNETPHDFVPEFDRAGVRVDGSCLYKEPVAKQVHNIVIPADIAFQDLASARIMDMWTKCILYIG